MVNARKKRKVKKTTPPLLIGLIIAAIAIGSILLIHFSGFGLRNEGTTQFGGSKSVAPRALVADSLMEDYPNPKLINYVADVLKEAGYRVDVVLGEGVNLTLYSRLTKYSVIILRTHGGKAVYRAPDGTIHKINGLFTGLLWSDKYYELKLRWFATRAYPYNSRKPYLAVLPDFFKEMMKGRFSNNSVVVVASCYSLYTDDIADALASKGLKAFVGWGGPVTLDHMDQALKKLVTYVFLRHETWEEAVNEVNKELGPDPTYGDYLKVIVFR